ncbi:MAG TPA: hypothetical protein VN033_11970 [Vulgatibacter sp.]|nr:hypothetical protein [Vulgatibacter sp.]
MADVVRFFMGPEDERAFLREVAPLGLELYPRVVPADWKAPRVDESLAGSLDESEYYLGIPEAGAITVDRIKRGPNKGKLMILEVVSPVIFFERSLRDEDGALRSGRLWAELQVSGDVQRRVQKTPVVERTFRKVAEIVGRRARRSRPVGWLILPEASRMHAEGVELRDAGRKGTVVRPYR